MASRRQPRKADDADSVVELILERIREERHFDFRNYKRATLKRRIERRMADRRCKSTAEYLALLEREPAEFGTLITSLLIKVTGFFRDREMWDALAAKVIPQILAQKRPGEEIRVWCAGCATGEEAFSVALLLAEAIGPAFHNREVKIFGTDVDESALSFARHGVYSREQVENVSPRMLKAWFVEESGGWMVRKEIRRAVVFGVNNLVSDAPISRLDLLLCRNVFIYLDAQLQKRVLTRFHYALRSHGLLVLGKSELIPFAASIFEPVDLQRRIYRKDGGRDSVFAQGRLASMLEQESIERETKEGREELGTVQQFHSDVVQSMRTAMIATAMDGSILLWNPGAAKLWGRAEGEVMGKKLPSLALPGLPGELLVEKTAAVREGKSEMERGTGVIQRPGDSPLQLAVELTPLRTAAEGITGVLYAVHDITGLREVEAELHKANEERQTALEELQSSNEELHSSNEELETTNEELQSANEELETTNEELQSTNAELDATNRELAQRTEEMNAMGVFQRATIRSLTAAVVVVDSSGRITLWNLAAERLLGIPETEAVGQLLWTLKIPALGRGVLEKMRKAISHGAPLRAQQVAYELPNGSEGQASVDAVPVVDGQSRIGAVIMFEDATRMASLASELAAFRAGNGGKDGKRNR